MSVYSAVLDRIDVVGRRTALLREVHPRTSLLTAGMAAVDLLAVAVAVAVVVALNYSAMDALAAGIGAGGLMTVVIAVRGGYRAITSSTSTPARWPARPSDRGRWRPSSPPAMRTIG